MYEHLKTLILIYRNVSKTSDRDNEKTLKVDKIEFFGNFPRNVFCAFAVTLLARPEKLDVDDHGCFVPLSYVDQVIVGRKVVLIEFFGNLHRRFLISSILEIEKIGNRQRKTTI